MLINNKSWASYSKKILLRLKKINDTPYSIAIGFACGVAISFTPFLGFHMLLAALTTLILRGNIIASAIGTLIGNPWTFPFIWMAVLYTGKTMLGFSDLSTGVNFINIFKIAGDALLAFDGQKFLRDVWPIFYPMLIGCIPFYIASFIISYKLVKNTMDKLAVRTQRKIAERKQK